MDSTLACLAAWMPRQRWYASKGHSPDLRLLAAHDLPSPDPSARVRTLIVADDSVNPVIVYQVPIVQRVATLGDDRAVIGTTAEGVVLVDGPRDPAFTTALWEALTSRSATPAARSAGAAEAGGAASTAGKITAQVLAGEQSNTSVIFTSTGSPAVICKLFRQLNSGLNPDIELQSALARAGSRHVPGAIGHLDAAWSDPGLPPDTAEDSGRAELTGSLAFAQEFLPGLDDAWRVACRAAEAGSGFAAAAHELGVTTAEVHADLGRLFPTEPPTDDARSTITGAWRRRLDIATAEVPSLAHHREAIATVYARAQQVDWPPLQRIHGDYHLGQVLHSPERGWVLLDFEGEPMRPMPERRRPDSTLRDVAGMLRSFDYVAGSLEQGGSPAPPEWAPAAREAFVIGYESRSGRTASGALLDAFELDKAVYEAIYETRNRPGWLSIPLAAIDRLLGSAPRPLGHHSAAN